MPDTMSSHITFCNLEQQLLCAGCSSDLAGVLSDTADMHWQGMLVDLQDC